jgi:hypothetical protein
LIYETLYQLTQMVNIFNEITIIDKFFKNDPINLKIKTHDLWSYLYNNLENENYNLFRWEFTKRFNN